MATGVELATGYVTLTVQTKSLGAQIGKAFAGGEGMAATAGKSMGRSMSKAFTKSQPDMDKLSDDVKLAEQRIAAHAETSGRKQEAAARKVEIAKAKLSETTERYGEKSSQALSAADRLAIAEQRLEKETISAADAQERLHTELGNAQSAYNSAADAAERSGSRAARAWDGVAEKLASARSKMSGIGQGFQDVGKQIGGVGSSLTKKITAPIGGAVTAAAGLVGVLGFKRLVGIDTARGQISGLGFDVEKVMKDVDKGVTDTSLSMAQGASIARSALATGNIAVGKELEAQIKRVANVSAAYGVESEHAGSLLNNVLTKNKVTYGDLSQMVQNNIPIISQLAEHYGVTGEEIQKMAQNGEISIADFNEVIDKTAGASAEAYAGTWQGVTSNIKANIGKLGADVLDGVFVQMKDEAGSFLEILKSDNVRQLAKDIGEKLAESLKKLIKWVRDAFEWFTALNPGLQKIILAVVAFAVAVGPLLIVIGKIATGVGGLIKVFSLFMNPIGLIILAIGALVGAFIYLWNNNEGFRNFFIKTWEKIKNFFLNVWNNYLKPAFKALGDFWTKTLAPALKTAWEKVIKPAFKALGDFFKWVWEKVLKPAFKALTWYWQKILAPALKFVWEKIIKPVFKALGDFFKWTWERVLKPAFDAVKTAWKGISDSIKYVWETFIKPVFDTFGKILKGDFVGAFQTAKDAVEKIWNDIKNVVKKPIKFVVDKVINDGLIGAFNKVTGFIDPGHKIIPKIGNVSLPAGFSDGGWTGPGTKYQPAGIVHAGEMVLRKEATTKLRRTIGMDGLNYMNETGKMPGFSDGGLVRPIKSGRITSRFGQRWGRLHAGTDWAVPTGTPVFAALAGRVLSAGWNALTGRTGIGAHLGHDGGRGTYYGHLSRLLVKTGDIVRKGQQIGLSGNTGRSTGPHLHFETHVGGKPVNPELYLNGAVMPEGGEGGGGFNPLQALIDFKDSIVGRFKEAFSGGGMFADLAQGTGTKLTSDILGWLPAQMAKIGDFAQDVWGNTKDFFNGKDSDVQSAVRGVAAGYGWGSGRHWDSLSKLISKESSWNPNAQNPTSTAYGLFQFLNSTWGSYGAKTSNPTGQAQAGMKYIKARYGDPEKAWAFHKKNNWYADGGLVKPSVFDTGGWLKPGFTPVMNLTGHKEAIYTESQNRDLQTLASYAHDKISSEREGESGDTYNVLVPQGATVDDIVDAIEFEKRRKKRG